MRFGLVGHLVAHAGGQDELAAVFKLGVKLAFQTEEDVSLGAPVVGQVARRVFHHAYAQVAELARAPIGHARVAGVFGAFDFGPVRGAEGDVAHLHCGSCVEVGGGPVWPPVKDRYYETDTTPLA
ncbi:hypothetical protein D3C73_1033870 [compost metagenome]